MHKKNLLEANIQLQKLIEKINYYDDLYYNKNQSEISDSEYDLLRQQLNELENLYPILKTTNSPNYKVGAAISLKFQSVKHLSPMLSLQNSFTINDIKQFIERAAKLLNVPPDDLEFCMEQKIDGVSLSLIYQNGKLIRAATRGNGYIGENVTQNAQVINDIPSSIDILDKVEIRGEVYMPLSEFHKLNSKFSTARNAASGSLRQLNSQITKARNLKFFAYYLSGIDINTQVEIMEKLKELGFSVCSFDVGKNITDMSNYFNNILDIKDQLPYDIDGVVFKINNIQYQKQLGFIGKNPRHSIAYKFPAKKSVTKLKGIEINVGRTGKLTPIGILEPIKIHGAMISKVTLHNFQDIEMKKISINDEVTIEKIGDVIPQITSIYKKAQNPIPITKPEICPICKTKLIKLGKIDLYCPNKYTCKSQAVGYITYFASKACFDIKGLGPKQIKTLFDLKLVTTPIDIFTLENKLNLQCICGWGELSINNLIKSINNSKTIDLNRFITSLCIPEIGPSLSKILANKFKNIDSFLNAQKEDLELITGLGEKKIENIMFFINNETNKQFVRNIQNYVTITN